MFDYPIPESCHFQEFYGWLNNATTPGQGNVFTFNIPSGASFIYAVLIGGGGRGGNGFTGAAGTARGGGGGGGSGAVTRILIPAKLLPSTIYVRAGVGAIPAAGSGSSILTLFANTGVSANVRDVIAIAPGGGDGSNGTASAGGTAGAAGVVMAATAVTTGNLGLWTSLAGQGGGAGGAHTGAAGAAVVWATGGVPVCGGAGGGGVGTANTDFAGGAITGNIVVTENPAMATITGGAAAAGAGQEGPTQRYGRGLFRSAGGSGGGTAGAAGTGGAGGPGGIGSGGGGGGGGVTGGQGGNGGPGWVGIWAW